MLSRTFPGRCGADVGQDVSIGGAGGRVENAHHGDGRSLLEHVYGLTGGLLGGEDGSRHVRHGLRHRRRGLRRQCHDHGMRAHRGTWQSHGVSETIHTE